MWPCRVAGRPPPGTAAACAQPCWQVGGTTQKCEVSTGLFLEVDFVKVVIRFGGPLYAFPYLVHPKARFTGFTSGTAERPGPCLGAALKSCTGSERLSGTGTCRCLQPACIWGWGCDERPCWVRAELPVGEVLSLRGGRTVAKVSSFRVEEDVTGTLDVTRPGQTVTADGHAFWVRPASDPPADVLLNGHSGSQSRESMLPASDRPRGFRMQHACSAHGTGAVVSGRPFRLGYRRWG